MKKQKNKFYKSLISGLMILFLWLLCLVLLFIVLKGVPNIFSEERQGAINFIIFFGLCPTAVLVFYSHIGFSVITFSERGVELSFLRRFHKRVIYWDEVVQTKIIYGYGNWLFISKSEIAGLSYEKLIKRKDLIQVELSKAVIDSFNRFSPNKLITK